MHGKCGLVAKNPKGLVGRTEAIAEYGQEAVGLKSNDFQDHAGLQMVGSESLLSSGPAGD